MHDQVVALDLHPNAVDRAAAPPFAASRSLSLTRSSPAPHPRRPPRAGRGDRQHRIFVDHARRPLRGHVDAAQAAMAHAQDRPHLPAFDPHARDLIGPHLAQARPAARSARGSGHARHRHRRPLDDSAATSGNAADDGSPAPHVRRSQLRLAPQAGHPPRADLLDHHLRPEMPQHRSVWSRVTSGSSIRVPPGAFSPASNSADFTCAEPPAADIDRQRLPRPLYRQRQPPAIRDQKCAPAAASGSVTRRIGRRRRLASRS